MPALISNDFKDTLLNIGIEKFRYQLENLDHKVIVTKIKIERSGDNISMKYFSRNTLIASESLEFRDGWTIDLVGIEMLMEVRLGD